MEVSLVTPRPASAEIIRPPVTSENFGLVLFGIMERIVELNLSKGVFLLMNIHFIFIELTKASKPIPRSLL